MTFSETQQVVTGRFDMLSLLGSGSMGKVYRVRDRELNVEVALKILNSDDELLVNRLRNELVVARKLSHPNIVRLHDFGRTEDGRVYISMEYVEGESLRERLIRARQRTSHGSAKYLRSGLLLAEVISVIKQVGLGLQYAHSKAVVHRDIKPENILISSDGEVKVADFGVARNLYVSAGLTIDGQTVGTPFYMSPEQVRGEKAGPAADLYAVGVVAFELCTGKPPFDGDNAMGVAYKHLHEPAPLDVLAASGAPEWLAGLIAHLLEKDPHRRPESVDATLEALSNARASGASLGNRPTDTDPLRRGFPTEMPTAGLGAGNASPGGNTYQGAPTSHPKPSVRVQSTGLSYGQGAPVNTPTEPIEHSPSKTTVHELQVDAPTYPGTTAAAPRGSRRSIPLLYVVLGAVMLGIVFIAAVGAHFLLQPVLPSVLDRKQIPQLAQAETVHGGGSAANARVLELQKSYIISPSQGPQIFSLPVPSGSVVISYIQPTDKSTRVDTQFQTRSGIIIDRGWSELSSTETQNWVVHVTREMNNEVLLVVNAGEPIAFRARVEGWFDAGTTTDAGSFSGDALPLPVDQVMVGRLPDAKDFDTYRFDNVAKGQFSIKVRPSDFVQLKVSLLDQDGVELASGESKNPGAMVALKVENPRPQSLFVRVAPGKDLSGPAIYSIVGGANPDSPPSPGPPQRSS